MDAAYVTASPVMFPQVPLFKVTHEGLSAILQDYRGRYNTVVGVRPTGWALQSKRGKVRSIMSLDRALALVYAVVPPTRQARSVPGQSPGPASLARQTSLKRLICRAFTHARACWPHSLMHGHADGIHSCVCVCLWLPIQHACWMVLAGPRKWPPLTKGPGHHT